MRIAVVGAGLGGVAAAVGLHRAGHDVALYERGAELREAGTGIVIMPNGLRALDALGLADRFRDHAMPGVTGGLRDWRGRPLLVTDVAEGQRTVGTTVVIGRTELHQTLRASLPPESVHTATPIQHLAPSAAAHPIAPSAAHPIASATPGDGRPIAHTDAGGVTLISDGRAIAEADAVIVADGIGSRLRGQLFPEHPGLRRVGRLDLRGMLPTPAGLDVTDLLAGILIDRRSGSMFGLFPVGERDLYWFTDSALPDGPPEAQRVGPSGDVHGGPPGAVRGVPSGGVRGGAPGAAEARRDVLALMADWHPAVPALIEATPPADIYVDAIACLAEPLPSFAVGRIALLGDAAHAMTPDLGQGASQAFEDAAALTRHLTGAGPADVVTRLRQYDAERRPRANRLMRASLRQSRLTSQTGAPAWLRDAVLRAIPQRLATRQLAALWHA